MTGRWGRSASMPIRVRFSWVARLLVLATLLASAQLHAQAQVAAEPSGASHEQGVTPPRPHATPLAYPEHADGAATVVLELTIDTEGGVADARALSGEAPFVDAALAA